MNVDAEKEMLVEIMRILLLYEHADVLSSEFGTATGCLGIFEVERWSRQNRFAVQYVMEDRSGEIQIPISFCEDVQYNCKRRSWKLKFYRFMYEEVK